jgi:hypothetical protein
MAGFLVGFWAKMLQILDLIKNNKRSSEAALTRSTVKSLRVSSLAPNKLQNITSRRTPK